MTRDDSVQTNRAKCRTKGSSSEQERLRVARDCLTRIFRFLKDLNEQRNPTPHELSRDDNPLWLDDWPVHPCIQTRRGDGPEEKTEAGVEAEMVPLIRIRRADLTPCPKAPKMLDGWLKPGWQSIDMEPEVLSSRNFRDKDRGSINVAFDADKDRVDVFNVWAAHRRKWAIAERPAVAARQLFEKVHALWTQLEREGDRVRLVLGDGLLEVPDTQIRHPVLLQVVNLEFEPSTPEFRIQTGTSRVELHQRLLADVPDVEMRMIAKLGQELETLPVEPLGGTSTSEFLRRLIQGLFMNGKFLGDSVGDESSSGPTLRRAPVLFLQPRSAGLSTMLDSIVSDLGDETDEPPEGLLRIVGVETRNAAPSGGEGRPEAAAWATPASSPDILFSKPTNAEQHEIAARLAKSKSVLVQGPPGTGKTHTIANLLGHLLAQGKTVLVTAHTTKALRVLRSLVDEALQPLCLSVLEGDPNSQNQLKDAAQKIADRLSGSNAESLRRDAGILRQKRSKLLDQREELRQQLRSARFSEIEEIVLGGETLAPIEAAKRVQANAERDGWVPGPLKPGVLCPLSADEVYQLYGSNRVLTPSDEAHLKVQQPELARLLPEGDFHQLVMEQTETGSGTKGHRPELWDKPTRAGVTAANLRELHRRVQMAVTALGESEAWFREVLFAGWSGGGLRETWMELLAALESLCEEAAKADRLIVAHGPELPEGRPVGETTDMLAAITRYVERHDSLGLFARYVTHRAWRQLIEQCRVDGRAPRTLDEFRALQAKAQLEVSRNRFLARWRRAVESRGGPALERVGTCPERAAQAYAQAIRKRLEWRTSVWEPLIGELQEAGFRWEAWLAEHPTVPGDYGELTRVQRAGSQRLAEVVEAQAAWRRLGELSASLNEQRTYLARFAQSEFAAVLLSAQHRWDAGAYAETHRELARLEGLQPAYATRLALLTRLQTAAVPWVHAIIQRQKPHDAAQPPGDPDSAWKWRQWYEELERRAQISISDLHDQLRKTEDELRRVAAQIIERETWAAQRQRTGLAEQQALMGYVQTIRKIGRGTGKRVPELLRQARQLLESAQRAVPVWIMPLSRVYENFDPRRMKFDVVIVDEASQSDVTALAALYLGREHVVVGDNEQVTPDAIGQTVEQVGRMIATDLRGIPNSHLYDGQTSIYDLAQTAFGGVIALREHFRCVPEIIQFSNSLSYNLSIRPLREPLSSPVRPALIAHRVNGFRDGSRKVNEVEAEEIASLVMACIEDPAYALNDRREPTTFGVISLLGDEQALLIETKLRQRLSPADFNKHRLLCGNSAQFQGDERDVVFLSMVEGPPADGQLKLLNEGPRGMFKKRYNVAVSRARNQLWVVHSLDPTVHLKTGDLRKRLIEHARDSLAATSAVEEKAKRTESVFEKLVLQRLQAASYRVRPQWSVGAFRIDLVVEDRVKRLAVECDGERWHTREELSKDLERQAVLERLGWVFTRIRGSLFFRDPDAAMAPVFAKLEQLGIEKLGEETEAPATPVGADLIERVRRNAERWRELWREEKEEGEGDTQVFGRGLFETSAGAPQ